MKMQTIQIILDVDKNPPLEGENVEKIIHIKEGILFTRVPHGMTSGLSAVSIIGKLPDGRHVVIEVSMRNFMGVCAAFTGAERRVAEGN